MMIPSFSSLVASILVLFLLARYGSAKLAMGPIRRRTTSEIDTSGTNDLETGLLSSEQKVEDEEEHDLFDVSNKSCCNAKCALKFVLLLHFIVTTLVIVTSLIMTSVMGPFWHIISDHTGQSLVSFHNIFGVGARFDRDTCICIVGFREFLLDISEERGSKASAHCKHLCLGSFNLYHRHESLF